MIIIIIIMTIINNNNHSTLGRTNGRSWRQRQSASYLALIRYFFIDVKAREGERDRDRKVTHLRGRVRCLE